MTFSIPTLRHVWAVAACTLLLGWAPAQHPHGHPHPHDHSHDHGDVVRPVERAEPWPVEVVEAFEHIPVQHRGRIKPLSTYASFLLLRFNSYRSFRTEGGQRLSGIEWFLDCLFYPDQAATYRHFEVTDSAVLDALGLSEVARKKRDRYSYEELLPGASKLDELAAEYAKIDSRLRTRIQRQVLHLQNNLLEFNAVTRYLDFARAHFDLADTPRLRAFFDQREVVYFSDVLGKSTELMRVYEMLVRGDLQAHVDAEVASEEEKTLESVINKFWNLGYFGQTPVLFPPEVDAAPSSPWYTPKDIVEDALRERRQVAGHQEVCAQFERMMRSLDDRAALVEAATALQAGIAERATERDEFGSIGTEVSYYKVAPFFWATIGFVLSFVCVTVSWLLARQRWPRTLVWWLAGASTIAVIVGFVMRCLILSRPPVLGIYDTIPYITAGGVMLAMFIERVNRRWIALPTATVLGAGGMFLADTYEASTGADTMGRLQAVLDTNFWLWTHVTTVTLGYAAALFAGFLAHVYIFGRLFHALFGKGVNAHASQFKALTKTVYGVICFGLVLSVVGTILGGIWANYSWGRFWGWDPKENGALLICLWEIAILHARMAGFIRDLGLNIMAAAGTMVVVFSWWGVNLMGKGLHSYGFTEGGAAVSVFNYAEIGVLAAGLLLFLLVRADQRQKEMPPPAEA